MRRSIPIVSLVFAAVAALPVASAQPPPDLSRLFPREADVAASHPGLARLPLDAEVLRDTRGDLSDLRVFDADGREVPWLVDSAVPPPPQLEQHSAIPLDARRETQEQGARTTVRREVYDLAFPETAPTTGFWDLVLSAQQGELVRQVTIMALRDDGSPGAELVRTSVFRLERPLRERMRITVPAVAMGRVRVTLEGEGDFLDPAFRFESTRGPVEPALLTIPLVEASRTREGSTTRIELDRPDGIVPDLLAMSTSSSAFYRSVRVRDAGPAAEERDLGGGVLYRIPDLPDAEQLTIDLTPARGGRLIVEIEDGDAYSLDDLRFDAVVRQPALLLSLEGPAVLRFGGGRAHPPRYDLARLAETSLGQRLASAPIQAATRSPVRANPLFDPSPALQFLMRPGNPVDAHAFSHERRITVVETPEGLSQVRVGAAELARSREDLGDLRIVDDQDRQWPYLLELDTDRERVELRIGLGETKDGWSSHEVGLAEGPVPVVGIELEVYDGYFDRSYEVFGILGDREQLVARGRIVRRPDLPESAGIVAIACEPMRVSDLRLRIHDGDDVPLRIGASSALVPVADLYVAALAGEYRLLLGSPDATPPDYEIARARDLVLAVTAAPVIPAELGRNPVHIPVRAEVRWEEMLLWVVLVLAVLVLAALTFRIARLPAATPEPEAAAPEPEPVGEAASAAPAAAEASSEDALSDAGAPADAEPQPDRAPSVDDES